MEGLVLPMATNISAAAPGSTSSASTNASLLFPRLVARTRWRNGGNLNFRRKPTKFSVFAAKEDPQIDEWDQVALKFGRMIGEDPKLTMAKIRAKKINPDATFLEIEKSFHRNNGKVVDVKEVPFEGSKNAQSSSSVAGVNLVRPVPKKGVKFQNDDNKPRLSELKKPVRANGGSVEKSARSSVPNVLLRKPSVFNEDGVEDKPSKLRIRRNLSLSMGSQPVKENFTDMTLLRKPEPVIANGEFSGENEVEGNDEEMEEEPNELTTPIRKPESYASIKKDEQQSEDVLVNEDDVEEQPNEQILIRKPEAYTMKEEDEKQPEDVEVEEEEVENEPNESTLIRKPEAFATTEEDEEQSEDELQLRNLIGLGFSGKDTSASRILDNETTDSVANAVSSLLKKPRRLEERLEDVSINERVETVPEISERQVDNLEFKGHTASSEFEESEDMDWERAESLVKAGQRGDVELLSSSSRGFFVSFGSLVGFLPYRNLSAKYKFLAFESWLRQKGLDPANYKQNLSVIGTSDFANGSDSVNGGSDSQLDKNISWEVSPNMKLEDLLRIYDQQKIKFLSSFIGQKVKANVIVADRKFRKLLFSVKPKENEELVEKKKTLMARLQIGDVVKCCIKKITYFGIFVEVEGVDALIHQTEVSWDSTLDPTAFYKIGQIVEAKVHQLDFAMERIFLSLKEITPDPLVEALESVVSESNPLDGDLQAAAQIETEWTEVDSLIKELQKIEGVASVSKGRFFISPGLAPTFQVYMSSMFENQYKLLARAENRVQELIVESSLGKEEIKSVILTCTNRVE